MLESVLKEYILLFLNPLPKTRHTGPRNETTSNGYLQISHFGQIYKRKAFSGQGLAHTSHFQLERRHSQSERSIMEMLTDLHHQWMQLQRCIY